MNICSQKLCDKQLDDKAETCLKCDSTETKVCCPICLLNHMQEAHPNNKENNHQYGIRKAKNLDVPNNSDPENYFYFKNFQIVKAGASRMILGKGAFAEVFLVKHRKDGKQYAMKKVEKRKLQNLNIIKEEINIHFGLDHENIIKLYSFTETNEFFYLIMEYAEKGNLYNEIRRKKGLREEVCRDYFIQVISAVSYLHSMGLAHRDIKPENLLLDAHKNIKVCDFGGAVKIEDGKERNTFFGTYEYMAPEVIEGNKYNCSVDIWALGILLYECLHGHSPFRVRKKN